jgi:hypothetical protein
MMGPISSNYLGTPGMLGLVCLFAIIVIKSIRSAYKRSRNSTGLHVYGADIVVAIGAGLLLGWALLAIWLHH